MRDCCSNVLLAAADNIKGWHQDERKFATGLLPFPREIDPKPVHSTEAGTH